MVMFGKPLASYSGSKGDIENPCVLQWKKGLCLQQTWLVHGATEGVQGTHKQTFRNRFVGPREKAVQILGAQSGGKGTVTAVWTYGCLRVSVWSMAVIRFPL